MVYEKKISPLTPCMNEDITTHLLLKRNFDAKWKTAFLQYEIRKHFFN